ncbi:MAG: hypothetical protein ABDH49_08200 [Candidatus Hydrothermales bacterium]
MQVYWQQEKLPLKPNFFGLKKPRFLEVGFGKGDFLVYLYALDQESPIIGIELSKKLIDLALKKLSYPPNLFLFQGDARFILKYVLPTESFEKIFLLFPFPWKKERHKERRIYREDFPETIWYSLKENGKFYVLTDEKFFYEELKERFLEKEIFTEGEFEQNLLEKAMETKYARKWKKLGKSFYYSSFKKIAEKKVTLEKKVKIINKIDHVILEDEKFSENYERKEKDKIFKIKRVFHNKDSKIVEVFTMEENFEQLIYFIIEKRKNVILKPLMREKIIFTEWILENLKNVFRFKP